MGGRGRLTTMLAAAALLAVSGLAARASGPGALAPWYLDQFGGEPTDLKALYDGRLGIVMAQSPRPQLYIAWRLLHGQKVGQAAGAALSVPCCDAEARTADDVPAGPEAWLAARKLVPGAADLPHYLRTEREGPNYTSTLNCFDEAFDTAAETLKERVARYGAGSPEIKAWLGVQDAVFRTCHDTGVVLPAALSDAPPWLVADRAYQAAAQALYDGRTDEAADRFAAIAKDRSSPWRPSAIYLRARSLVRGALQQKTPDSFAAARAAIADLAATPTGTYGHGEAKVLSHVLAFRERPVEYAAQIGRDLAPVQPPADVAVLFRDWSDLADSKAVTPDALDWMATMRARPAQAADADPADQAWTVKARLVAKRQALAHAQARWAASHDVAWLIAGLSLTDPGTSQAKALIPAGEAVAADSPAWLTVQHHLVRLTIGTADPGRTRARLDAILARRDLSVSDRNIFTAARAQVAANMADFTAHALRRRLCPEYADETGCLRLKWDSDDIQPYWAIYDGRGDKGTVGFGEDARAVIDRLPLASRIALSRMAALPTALRLDVALTSYARAVQLQDNAAIDGLAADLGKLLPQLSADWKRIGATPPGSDKRFAEFLILAKIPGLRTDLVDYIRPEGPVDQFQQYWTDWIVLPRGRPAARHAPRPLALYQQGGTGADAGYGDQLPSPDAETDLTCLGECGRGYAPLRLPAFAAAGQPAATAERGYLFSTQHGYGKPEPRTPPGGTAAWDEMLVYIQTHASDPRSPEALYWLVHVGRFGGTHNHSGRRAFNLLHARYPKSSWAAKTPYYYD
jgi:hypothetical protein